MRNALSQRRATELRQRLTDAEQELWRRLRRRQIRGLRFRRQTPIGPYITDFVCLEVKLAIEVDGSQHADSHHDVIRDEYFRKNGYEVLRYWSHDVLRETDAVVESIYQAIKTPPP
jgi:primosomal protein N' (replication factor Y)